MGMYLFSTIHCRREPYANFVDIKVSAVVAVEFVEETRWIDARVSHQLGCGCSLAELWCMCAFWQGSNFGQVHFRMGTSLDNIANSSRSIVPEPSASACIRVGVCVCVQTRKSVCAFTNISLHPKYIPNNWVTCLVEHSAQARDQSSIDTHGQPTRTRDQAEQRRYGQKGG